MANYHSIFYSFPMKKHPFVPQTFQVPGKLTGDGFVLRMLSVTDVVTDYAAVMSSIDHLRTHFAYCSAHSVFGDSWPADDLTITEDLADLGWHEVEFRKRTSFTYTVVDTSGKTCLGCVYILPAEQSICDAEVYLWVTSAAFAEGLDAKLFKAVRSWLSDEWPFSKVAFPGRELWPV